MGHLRHHTQATAEQSSVAVKTELLNRSNREAHVVLRSSILDAGGRQVAQTSGAAVIPAGGSLTVPGSLSVPKPERWDIDHPYLYTLVSEVFMVGFERSGPLHHAVRHSHHRLHPRERFPPQWQHVQTCRAFAIIPI